MYMCITVCVGFLAPVDEYSGHRPIEAHLHLGFRVALDRCPLALTAYYVCASTLVPKVRLLVGVPFKVCVIKECNNLTCMIGAVLMISVGLPTVLSYEYLCCSSLKPVGTVLATEWIHCNGIDPGLIPGLTI